MIKNISNLGDSAIYCDFGKEVNEKINLKVISYFNYLKKLVRENKIEGITNLTPSYNKLIISFDLSITNFKKIANSVVTPVLAILWIFPQLSFILSYQNPLFMKVSIIIFIFLSQAIVTSKTCQRNSLL